MHMTGARGVRLPARGLASLAASCLCGLPMQLSPHSEPAPPNLLVIVLDDAGWPERPFLPSLDALAARGTTFTQFYTHPVCSPTRYALLHGRLPRREGIGDIVNAFNSAVGASPPPDRLAMTLAEAVKPTHLTCLIGKWHLGRAAIRLPSDTVVDLIAEDASGPTAAGFDETRAVSLNSIGLGPGASGYYDWHRVQNHARTANFSNYATAEQRDQFVAWWQASASHQRFAWLAFNAPHSPYDTPPGYPILDPADVRGRYLQLVSYVDGALRELLSHVDLSDTVVVFLSDNGTPDDARPAGWPSGVAKGSTFQGGVRIPLIIAGAGVTQGVSSRLVSDVDLAPTLLEVLGLRARGFEDGLSFADELGPWRGTLPRRWLSTERFGNLDSSSGSPFPAGYDDLALVEAPSLLPGTHVEVQLKRRIVDVDGAGPGGFQDLVYDLVRDPFERSPVVFSALQPVLRARLDAELASLPPRR